MLCIHGDRQPHIYEKCFSLLSFSFSNVMISLGLELKLNRLMTVIRPAKMKTSAKCIKHKLTFFS